MQRVVERVERLGVACCLGALLRGEVGLQLGEVASVPARSAASRIAAHSSASRTNCGVGHARRR